MSTKKSTGRTTNRFERGSAVYCCRICTRNTRSTGRGDNELVQLCAECYDLGGEENHLSDTGGDFYSSPEEILRMIAFVAEKGGLASHWDDLKRKAQAKLENPAEAYEVGAAVYVTSEAVIEKHDALTLPARIAHIQGSFVRVAFEGETLAAHGHAWSLDSVHATREEGQRVGLGIVKEMLRMEHERHQARINLLLAALGAST